jgi:DNA polymerase delta subunit 2
MIISLGLPRHYAKHGRQHWIVAPPARDTYISDGVQIYLEDKSGRLALTGAHLKKHLMVTGAIIATMGTENASGEFEVVDVKVADLPRQPERWEREDSALALKGEKPNKKRPKTGKIALVSGLDIKGDGTDTILLDLLTEYLLGESSSEDTPQISRLIIAGNSLAHASPIPSREELAEQQPGKNKYGHDTTVYDPTPSEHLDIFLAQLLPSIPITLLPGATDPSSVAVPQQSLHPALFPHSRSYANLPTQEGGDPSWFDSVTNPWEGDIDGLRFLGNSGQPIDDMYKYVKGGKRLDMMEHLLRWRNNAPTAPDTLCTCCWLHT